MNRVEGGVVRHVLRLVTLALGWFVLAAEPAHAHMMPAQQGTLNVLGNAVFAVLSLPVSALSGVDDDGDGHLSPVELRAHEVGIRDTVTRRVRIADGDRVGRVDFLQLMADSGHGDSVSSAGSTQFLVLMKTSFDGPPTALRIETDFWGQSADERQLTIKATRGPDAEAAVLTPRRASYDFFRSPWRVLGDNVSARVKHLMQSLSQLFA